MGQIAGADDGQTVGDGIGVIVGQGAVVGDPAGAQAAADAATAQLQRAASNERAAGVAVGGAGEGDGTGRVRTFLERAGTDDRTGDGKPARVGKHAHGGTGDQVDGAAKIDDRSGVIRFERAGAAGAVAVQINVVGHDAITAAAADREIRAAGDDRFAIAERVGVADL